MTLTATPLTTTPPTATPLTATVTRELLDLAFARLRRLGILAAGALPGDAAATREALSAAIRARFPAAACSYAFWTADDDTAFDAGGRLVRPLPLHVTAPVVADAVRAALAERGIDVVEGPRPLTLEVVPGTS